MKLLIKTFFSFGLCENATLVSVWNKTVNISFVAENDFRSGSSTGTMFSRQLNCFSVKCCGASALDKVKLENMY